MRDLKLDNNGDVDITSGKGWLTNDLGDTARQSLQIALKTFYGEWKLDNTIGVPYLQSILGQKTNLAHSSNLIRASVYGEKLIRSVTEFRTFLDNRTRTLTVTFKAVAVDGSAFDDKIEISI